MINPPPFPTPSSYDDLLKQMSRRMRQSMVGEQIVDILKQTYENELAKQNMVLSRPERVRLFQQIGKAILTEALEKVADSK